MKKITLILLTMLLVFSSFSGCTPQKKINNSDAAITVGSQKITVGEIRFLIEDAKSSALQDKTDEQKKEFWETEKDGKKPEVFIMDEVIDSLVQLAAVQEEAAKQNITVASDELNAQISKSYTLEQLQSMAANGKSDVDSVKAFFKKNMVAQKYMQTLQSDPKMNPEEPVLKAFFKDSFLKAQHILKMTVDEQSRAPLPQTDIDNKKKEIDELLVKAKTAGQDFTALMSESSEDPGSKENPDGYVFTEGQMVEEFYNTAKSLKDNEISSVVETEYGYHIIKRVPFNADKEWDANKDAVLQAYQQAESKKIIENLKNNVTIEKKEDILKTITVK